MEGAMDLINTAVTNVVTLVGTAYDAMIAQPIISLFVGASVISLGLVVFGRMKRSAR